MSPWKPKRPCRMSSSGCPNLQPCPTHPILGRWEGRGTAAERGYGWEHRQWRTEVLTAQPWCVDPDGVHRSERRPSVQADHVVSVASGGARYDVANGQGLCITCHNTKSGREGQARR